MKKTFTAAMLHYFGKQPEQSLSQFQSELSQLTDTDKTEMRSLLETVGYEIEPSQTAVA